MGGQLGENSVGGAAVRARLAVAMLGLLHQTRQAHFDELVQITNGDGEKFHPFQKRVALVARFFQNTLIELHPGEVSI
jgi:hypothetical protein